MECIYVVCCTGGTGWGSTGDRMIRAFKSEEAAKAYLKELKTIHERNKKRMDELNDKNRAGQMTKDDWDEHGSLRSYFDWDADYTAYHYMEIIEFVE